MQISPAEAQRALDGFDAALSAGRATPRERDEAVAEAVRGLAAAVERLADAMEATRSE